MLYSVYTKWIMNDNDIENIDQSELPILNAWIQIGENLSPNDVMEVLLNCENSVYADSYIQVVLPELNIGDKVMNIKNNQIGTVVYFDQSPVQRFDEIYVDEQGIPMDGLFEYVTVESEGETLNWEMKNLIVINGSTIQ